MSSFFAAVETAVSALPLPGSLGGELKYLRGALVAYAPRTYNTPQANAGRRVIPFRFNPESLTRSVSLEGAHHPSGVEGAAHGAPGGPTAPAPASAETAADQTSGTLKETFTIQVRFDYADRDPSAFTAKDEFGIAPEIAAIEDLLYPDRTPKPTNGGTSPLQTTSERPTVLFVWGKGRVVPVRIASMKIEESVYNDHLYPVRAELELSLEVLGQPDAANDAAVRAALDHTDASRRTLADQYYATTSAQAYANIFPL